MKRWVGTLGAAFVLTFVIFFAFLSSFGILPFALLPRGRRERWANPAARLFAWASLHFALFARIDARGLHNLPRKGGYLIICNHRSWTDVALLICLTGSLGISKREIVFVPFFGLNGYLAGAIFFDRRSKASRARVVDDALFLLRSGRGLHVFPEGTRTRDGRLNPKVHLRMVQAAFDAGIPVVPVCVWGTERSAPAAGVQALPFQSVGIEVEPPMDRAGYPDAESYAAACWERVRSLAAARGADAPFDAHP